MLTGILGVEQLPVQSTVLRFLGSLHLAVARQRLEVTRGLRQRVWQAAHVELEEVTLDTDTTVQTVYGRRKMGARTGYNPKHRERKAISVCPAKAGVFSGSQPHQNKSQSSVASVVRQKFFNTLLLTA